MDKKYLTAPCGLDCFNCGALEENITDEYKHSAAAQLGVSPDEIVCRGGCRGEQGKCIWAQGDCAAYSCAEKKGVTYCFECSDFPCALLAPSAKGVYYPHNMKVYNLCRMKRYGMDAWIAEAADIRKRYYEGDFVVGQGPVLRLDSNEN
jgi:hypothetical protein